jgi:3-hydroxyisobutyrate dehydrogenase
MTRVAVIGVGRMGAPIARRLIAAGHQLTVCDAAPEPIAELCDAGAEPAPDAATAAARSEISITCLPTPAIVETAVLGERGVLGGASPGSALIEMSTSLPSLARRLAQAGQECGVDVLDAPVSGGPHGATQGTLAIMVGGEQRAFARVMPLLQALGAVVRHMGGAGAGQATKLTNNILAATHMAVLAEAVALARSEGLELATVYEIISNGTGDSRVLRDRYPVPGVVPDAPASRGWAPQFPVDLIAKDVELALLTAAEHGLDLPLAAAALARYQAAQAAHLGGLDYSAVARLLRSD